MRSYLSSLTTAKLRKLLKLGKTIEHKRGYNNAVYAELLRRRRRQK